MTTPPGAARLRIGAGLSLSGEHARFGTQALRGLEVWKSGDDGIELVVEDDRSDPRTLEATLRALAKRCDVLLGPYSTRLARHAGDVAADLDLLIWNHGGSGDDVEAAHPGHVVSVLTPAGRYAEPFVRLLAGEGTLRHLCVVHGRGGFGRQVAAGAELTAHRLGLHVVRLGPGAPLPAEAGWALLCAGSFEEDVETVRRARALPMPPGAVCSVAAGVRGFGEAVDEPHGVYGVGQWSPGSGSEPELGITEPDFLAGYRSRTGTLPDYPAVQAAATAVIATHCVRLAGAVTRDALWQAAVELETTTLFGAFKIAPDTGTQLGHRAVLVRWGADGPVAVRGRRRPES
ncbi:ABC transporter substrate-binding protein [Microtetraspora sp. NBRC 13810]|uniref:ABC transporter substrate-binding protein n=1 Tax=Microtetraspora sp. NBRC 13810 TaxID=3030990 RepID=UPI0025545477|nr:ABC transporter substrate-binding protein [Microtetraspora sp. NBRC 13810]